MSFPAMPIRSLPRNLPRYLAAEQVNLLIAACDGEVVERRRDRAILLLLARLGLRAGDVAGLRIGDIEWEAGTLRVSGKWRYQVRLPLPQEVGEAILNYLECRPVTATLSSFETSHRTGHSSEEAAYPPRCEA